MTLTIDPYPCYWPDGWARTPDHKRSDAPYKVELGRARDELIRHLKLDHARQIVISSNVPLRRDGLPLAGQSEPRDPAVAVYWVEYRAEGDRTLVIACDRWRKVKDNMRACGLAIESMRALRRSGATQALERAFLGLAALPANAGQRPWREVFGWPIGLPFSIAMLNATYRELAAVRHPDRGGSQEAMSELNAARDAAIREHEQRTRELNGV